MANHPSAEKRNRQRVKRTDRNRAAKSSLRTTLKKARAAATTGADNAGELARVAESELDRAAKKGVIPVERASRLKARAAKARAKAATTK